MSDAWRPNRKHQKTQKKIKCNRFFKIPEKLSFIFIFRIFAGPGLQGLPAAYGILPAAAAAAAVVRISGSALLLLQQQLLQQLDAARTQQLHAAVTYAAAGTLLLCCRPLPVFFYSSMLWYACCEYSYDLVEKLAIFRIICLFVIGCKRKASPLTQQTSPSLSMPHRQCQSRTHILRARMQLLMKQQPRQEAQQILQQSYTLTSKKAVA